jgi:hypothetical protein
MIFRLKQTSPSAVKLLKLNLLAQTPHVIQYYYRQAVKPFLDAKSLTIFARLLVVTAGRRTSLSSENNYETLSFFTRLLRYSISGW